MQKKYYERKQLKHRKTHGKVEKRSELIERLKKKKEVKEKIKQAKLEIENKTGKEYFFKYNSVKKQNSGQLVDVIKDTKEELDKKRIFVDKEIDRVENKLKEFLIKIKPNKIVFDEDGTPIKKECGVFLEQDSEEMNVYKEYLNQLLETKSKITEQLEEIL
ncbi:hypothetical protein NGRA_0984 [Nosema granulosis]|uniref:Uncharacterized protein n=1 Tax=Nosema granulosis TaxID=83296 RepID=A0A9P6KZI8_9MICR|nr:hypothetical protein NGRA_0984 [Nosema granulosis]